MLKQVKRIYIPLPDASARRLLFKHKLKGHAFSLPGKSMIFALSTAQFRCLFILRIAREKVSHYDVSSCSDADRDLERLVAGTDGMLDLFHQFMRVQSGS